MHLSPPPPNQLPFLPKQILGSAAVFGDPIRLVHHLGLGVWSVLASPAAGLVESARSRGPAQLLLGLAEGPRAAAAHFAFALSNAAGKTTAAARKAMSALGLDRWVCLREGAGGPVCVALAGVWVWRRRRHASVS